MAKQEANNEVVFATETEPMFESEAYSTPQPEVGADVTVTKPVGIGAPVPIIAPKHTTVQLQPIVVPLAVIPYMSLDSDTLVTNRVEQQPVYQAQPAYAQQGAQSAPAEFASVATGKNAKPSKAKARVFSLITLVLAVLTLVPYIIASITKGSTWAFGALFGQSVEEFRIGATIVSWLNNGFAFRGYISEIVMMAVAALAVLLALSTLISLIVGKYARVLNCLFALGTAIGLGAILVKDLVTKQFVLADRVLFVVVLALSVLGAILAIAFSVALGRDRDKVERLEDEI